MGRSRRRRRLSIKELAAAGLGPVELGASIKYLHESALGDEVDVITRFEYPAPKVDRLVQPMIRRSDGALRAIRLEPAAAICCGGPR